MSAYNKPLTVDELITELSGRGHYKVGVEEYTIDDGDPELNDTYELVEFSGTP